MIPHFFTRSSQRVLLVLITRPLSGRKITLNCAIKASFCTKNILNCSHRGVNCSPGPDRHTFRIRSPYPVARPPHRRLPFCGSSSSANIKQKTLCWNQEKGGWVLPAFSHGVWPISYDNPCQLLLQISSVLTWCVSEAALWMWNIDVLWAIWVFQAGTSQSKESGNGPNIGYKDR